jgi:hypothetical protein
MHRASLEEQIRLHPGLEKLLHECWGCHAVGLKPGILDTKYGDYGNRQYYGSLYPELPLDSRGLCPACAENPPVDITDADSAAHEEDHTG